MQKLFFMGNSKRLDLGQPPVHVRIFLDWGNLCLFCLLNPRREIAQKIQSSF